MNILKPFIESESFASVAAAAKSGKSAAIFGAGLALAPAVAAALRESLDAPILAVAETDAGAARLARDIEELTKRPAALFPSREFVFLDIESTSREVESQRLAALGNIVGGSAEIVVCSLAALSAYTMPKEAYKRFSFKLEKGARIDPLKMAQRLVATGYTRADRVDGAGQFSIRGGIIDIFAPDSELPVRMELWGDDIDDVWTFDPESQRRIEKIQRIYISPAREVAIDSSEDAIAALERYKKNISSELLAELVDRDIEFIKSEVAPPSADRYIPLFYERPETILDYMPDCCVLFCEPGALASRAKEQKLRNQDTLTDLAARGIFEGVYSSYYSEFSLAPQGRAAVYAEPFSRSLPDIELAALVNLNGAALPSFSGDFSQILEEVSDYTARGYACAILAGTDRNAKSLVYDLEAAGLRAHLLAEAPAAPGEIAVGAGKLASGFDIASARYAVFTTRHADKKKKSRYRGTKRSAMFGSLEDLHEGDYVVHVAHGIGQFAGIHRIDHHGLVRDYIKVQYRGADTLYVPVTQLDMVSPYVAPREGGDVKLAKLHSGEWARTKSQVYRAAREMAKELIALYAKREQEPGFAFSPDNDWQRDFESRFPYDETDDQLKSIAEIKSDMQRAHPMDRLLCGDVGVGKTEVALRAAFKCVLDSKQCAVLVPTTILAWQHMATFVERLEPFPVKVAMFSRFSTAKEIREGIKGLRDGTVDIAIGTHRILQKDIDFKDLGLLIVDEEQRFGVAHKEKLKERFAGVDVLTLSATPIPRTLNMAMTGIRDISVIEYPPEDRQPVQTYVLEYDDQTIHDALARELARGGQAYYLHNRIDSIELKARKLAEQFPDAVVGVAHGAMSEQELSRVWQQVMNAEIDILVCTTIIETGVDVANCNTLIVENADRLGLAQLYQIRGRVGRSARRAYAYFTFQRDRVITEVGQKRLAAIRDFTSFGSGFKIAMRDLQIRGAGGILSARQSGHMEAVGYETYVKILEQAVSDELGEASAAPAVETVVDIKVNAYIPESYVSDNESRIDMYKKIAAISSEQDEAELLDELADRFGPVPREVRSLCGVALLRALAQRLLIYEVDQKDTQLLLYTDHIDDDAVKRMAADKSRGVLVSAKGKSYISVSIAAGELPVEAGRAALLAALAAPN